MEESGLSADHLPTYQAHLRAPVLVVGAGQGALVARLRALGLRTEGVDASPAMVAAARARRGISLALADGAALPFEAASYQSVLLPTGVLDGGAGDGPILADCERVLAPGGRLLLALFRPSLSRLTAARGAGIVGEGAYQRARMVQAWRTPRSDWPALVRGWTGQDGNPSDLSVLVDVIELLDALATCLRRQGVDALAVLEQAFAEPQPYFTSEQVEALCAGRGYRLVGSGVHGDVLMIVAELPVPGGPS